MFRSDRLREHAAGPNPLAAARDELVRRGESVVDLVTGTPAPAAVRFPENAIGEVLEEARGRIASYAPDPKGRPEAREAVAAYYRQAGIGIPPEHILLTPGTSLSYLYAFSVLAEPGDEVLVPRPSYPLFGEIARLPAVRLVPYWLRETDGWRIDLEHLESQVSRCTRAIVLISPHNPTGAVASVEEVAGVAAIARRHDLAVIADEVFRELAFEDAPTLPAPAAIGDAPLVLTLNGFSKMFALPGWKLGWIAASGDEDRVAKAIWMLEHVSDAFLPVSDLAQAAAAGIFARAGDVPRRLREHARRGRDLAVAALSRPGATEIVPPAGGFFLTMRLAGAELREDEVALDLLRRFRVLVHPGAFYDLPPDHLVLSYAAAEVVLRPALESIVTRIGPPVSGP